MISILRHSLKEKFVFRGQHTKRSQKPEARSQKPQARSQEANTPTRRFADTFPPNADTPTRRFADTFPPRARANVRSSAKLRASRRNQSGPERPERIEIPATSGSRLSGWMAARSCRIPRRLSGPALHHRQVGRLRARSDARAFSTRRARFLPPTKPF